MYNVHVVLNCTHTIQSLVKVVKVKVKADKGILNSNLS